ncbi:MAG: DUF3857 domain-containing protein, partial [Litorimonas sp.]
VLDAADLSEAMIYRTETDRDQMIFNGTLTFSLPILDLRVGDRLDVAYTIDGRNPAIGPGFLSRKTFDSVSERIRFHVRVMVGPGLSPRTKRFNDPPEPTVTEEGGWTVFTWDRPDPQVPDYEDDTPAWAYVYPTFEISAMDSWSAVGDWFAPSYAVTDAGRAATADIVREIASQTSDPKLRARAALDWVQTHIRYVGMELGEGGFVPRPAARVLRRRFGDCKDVTLLLLTLLEGLDVEAAPLLVNTSQRGGEFGGLPHPYAFDHILVLAEIGGALYPLDATRDPQVGTLDTLEKGGHAKGLRLAPQGSEVVELPQSDYEFREVVHERFDLVSDDEAILYTLSFGEFGEDADATLNWISGSGEEDVADGFLRYLRDIYPTIEPDGDMVWEVDHDEARTRLDFTYRLPGYGRDARTKLETRAFQLLSAVPDFVGGARVMPHKLDHPRSVQHVREYVGDERYAFSGSQNALETDAFRFVGDSTVDGHTLRETHSWVSKQDHMAAETFEADMETVEEIIDLNYTTITLALGGRSATGTDPGPVAKLVAWLVLLGFPAGGLWLFLRSRKRRQARMS